MAEGPRVGREKIGVFGVPRRFDGHCGPADCQLAAIEQEDCLSCFPSPHDDHIEEQSHALYTDDMETTFLPALTSTCHLAGTVNDA